MKYDNRVTGRVINSSVMIRKSEWGGSKAGETFWNGAGSAARLSRAGGWMGRLGGWAGRMSEL